jgi:hypothetical protein
VPLIPEPNERNEKGARGAPFLVLKQARGLQPQTPMNRRGMAFAIGLGVTVVTTLAHPGGAIGSFVVGTMSGTLAVGIATMLLRRRP